MFLFLPSGERPFPVPCVLCPVIRVPKMTDPSWGGDLVLCDVYKHQSQKRLTWSEGVTFQAANWVTGCGTHSA